MRIAFITSPFSFLINVINSFLSFAKNFVNDSGNISFLGINLEETKRRLFSIDRVILGPFFKIEVFWNELG